MISPRVVISVIIVDNFETITILRRRARGVFWMELGKTHRADTEASTQSSSSENANQLVMQNQAGPHQVAN